MLTEDQVRDLLHRAANSIPVSQQSSEELLRHARRTHRNSRFGQVVLAAAAVVLVIGGAVVIPGLWDNGGTPPTVVGEPKPPPPPSGITISPGTAKPGETITLTFAPDNKRAVAFSMDKRVKGAWQRQYILVAATEQGEKPYWFLATVRADPAPPDGASVGGRGPEYLTVPDTATVGVYRLCTVTTRNRVCGLFNVAAQGNSNTVHETDVKWLTDAERRAVRAFYRFADRPQSGRGPFDMPMLLGFNGSPARTIGFREWRDAAAWRLHPGYGPHGDAITPMDLISENADNLRISRSPQQNACLPAEDIKVAPAIVGGGGLVSVQPRHYASCRDWWSVDLSISDDGQIVGVNVFLGNS